MKSPRFRNEVTKEWLEYMLTEYESRKNPGSKVTLQTWDIGDGTKKGDGYSGDLVKLEAKGTVQYTGEKPQEKEYNHLLKFRSPDAFMQEMLKKFQTAGNESKIYSTIIEEFNKFQADLSDNQFPINIPTHIYSKDNDKEHILVMENMKLLDYNNNSKQDMLGLEEAKLALEQLARLHGISYAYDKKHNFLKKYPTYEIEIMRKMLVMGQEGMIDMIIAYLKTQDENQDLLKKVVQSKPHTLKRMSEAFDKRNNQVYCLVHGDPWNNNILLKQNGGTKENKVVFIDWEASNWNTSAYDLVYFMAGAITPDMRKQHLDELLQHYHSHFTSVTTVLGSPIHNWGFEQLKTEVNAVLPWGLSKNLTFAMILSEASKDWNVTKHNNKAPGKFKKGMAKAFVPLMVRPSTMKMMMNGMMKKFTRPVLKELENGSNDVLNERILACILEADQNGLFEIPSK